MLEVKNLSVSYSKKQVLEGVNFILAKGETIGILGKSGAGKTTILRALIKALPKESRARGEVIYKGKNLLELTEKEFYKFRGRVFGFLPQNAQAVLNPFLRIEKAIAESIKAHKKLGKRQALVMAHKFLELVGIDKHWWRAYPSQLSGGMKTRSALACLLASGAEFLFLDEPTTGLDIVSQKALSALLGKIRQERNPAILIVSHNLSFLFQVCQKIYVLDNGKISEEIDVQKPKFKTQLSKQFIEAFIIKNG